VGVSLAIPKTLAVSGGVSLRCPGSVLFGVAGIFCARAREGFPIAAPVPWSRNHRRHHGLRIGRAIRATHAICATSRCGNQLNSAHVFDTKRFFDSSMCHFACQSVLQPLWHNHCVKRWHSLARSIAYAIDQKRGFTCGRVSLCHPVPL
jgi:hypothetical protein